MTVQEARQLLKTLPREPLGFYPTPLHKLERLSRETGVNLYLKRDDLSGINLFGGNKMRKLEFMLGDALSKGCDTVFTYGATQSNHAMQTVTACRKCGLNPILYLVSIVEPDMKDLKANLLLDYIYGAEVNIVYPKPGEAISEAEDRSYQMGAEHAKRLEARGLKPYIVPMGGASDIGTVGFISGFLELTEQLEAMKIRADYLYHATGTGSTMAGLAAGRVLTQNPMKVVSIAVSPKDEGYEARSADLATRALKQIGADIRVTAEDLCVDRDYYQPGYEIPNEKGNNAIRRLARLEGILMDTVYSGKGLGGLLDHIATGRVPQGSNVVFWHTGGATALFAERDIIGDLAQA